MQLGGTKFISRSEPVTGCQFPKTKLLFLGAQGGGLPQSWTAGKAISYSLLHPPQVKETWCVEAVLLWMQINSIFGLSGELGLTWGGWGFLWGQNFLQTEIRADGHRDWQGSEAGRLLGHERGLRMETPFFCLAGSLSLTP